MVFDVARCWPGQWRGCAAERGETTDCAPTCADTLSAIRGRRPRPAAATTCKRAGTDAIKFQARRPLRLSVSATDLTERGAANALLACCRIDRQPAAASGRPAPRSPMSCAPCPAALASNLLRNFSVFRSAPDTWGVDSCSGAPIIASTNAPTALGSFADLTCDSDGKAARLLDAGRVKPPARVRMTAAR